MDTLLARIQQVCETQQRNMTQVITACGCSKSHFYKVINKERVASPQLVEKLASVSGCSTQQVEALLAPASSVTQPVTGIIRPRSNFWPPLLFALLMILAVLSAFYAGDHIQPVTAHGSIAGDEVSFVKDVTIPDGSQVKTGSTFVKTWRIKNSGKVRWQQRYLVRLTPLGNGLCHSVEKISVPHTAPGQSVDLSVEFTAPTIPGSCRTDWKMTDSAGTLMFPDHPALFSIVQVVL